ncbi:hypothetical protein EUGRSUZ_A00402 [Eucalyptus grandis]|uniref:Uncharacterized protein n=2 Tax=Eucalyptus grandis TaxID=71139 RepID=A0A059DCQ9_EUCGR|nr:hypothetical protein EUGRSUZ_A00402 [Eucalyptus grandis]
MKRFEKINIHSWINQFMNSLSRLLVQAWLCFDVFYLVTSLASVISTSELPKTKRFNPKLFLAEPSEFLEKSQA